MIRKLAHFIEFAGLGFLLICDVYLFSDKPKKYICWALFIGLFVACVDETIQLYSPGRSSKIMDVWVDFSGVMSATVVTVILIKTVFKNLLPVLKAK